MTLPRVQPIAPTWHKEPFDDSDWLFDFKYDGFRALCYLEQRPQSSDLAQQQHHDPAQCLRVLGDAAGALPLYRRALDSSERVLGKKHPETLANNSTGVPVS